MIRLAVAAACLFGLLAQQQRLAIAQFANHASVLFPGSRIALQFAAGAAPATAAAFGAGSIDDGSYVVPLGTPPSRATLVAASASALAARSLRVVAPPHGAALAVASYDDGIVFHDPRSFAMLGTLATSGPPSDVAALGGEILATDTDGTALTVATMTPWDVRRVDGVPLGDEIAVDPQLHAFFVTERDFDGRGGVARVADATVRSTVTGTTAEGVAVDERRQRLYVADVNDNSVAVVDARSLRVLGHIGGLPRAFSLALSQDGSRLYVVSNQGATTFFAAPGRVSEILLGARPRIVARSAQLTFPVGAALDGRNGTLFVTDEEDDTIDVLDARTLSQRHAPIPTCTTPWKPTFDEWSGRLFVPCAGSNEVDALDARTFRRVRGAPFATGGYPLAVSVVRP